MENISCNCVVTRVHKALFPNAITINPLCRQSIEMERTFAAMLCLCTLHTHSEILSFQICIYYHAFLFDLVAASIHNNGNWLRALCARLAFCSGPMQIADARATLLFWNERKCVTSTQRVCTTTKRLATDWDTRRERENGSRRVCEWFETNLFKTLSSSVFCFCPRKKKKTYDNDDNLLPHISA